MSKLPTVRAPDVEPLDLQEIVDSIDKASTIFATGCSAFCDLRSLFEAIAVASQGGTLASRLASLGRSLCESHEIEFDHYLTTYDLDAERFAASLGIAPEVRHE